MDGSPNQQALRRGRVSLDRHAYLVTTVTRDREPLFANFDCGCAAARAITDARAWDDAELLAWVLMPDHWHVLVALGERRRLSQVVQRLKAHSAREGLAVLGRSGRLWQPGFHDHAIRGERNLEAAARYLIANPLRAGLVESIAAYPFWGSRCGGDVFQPT